MSEPLKPLGAPSEIPTKDSGNLPDVVFTDLPLTGLPSPSDKPYNPHRDRENVRSFVAFGLLALLIIVVIASYVCLSAGWIAKDDLKDLLTIVFGPIITLLGAVTGFYYGEKSNS